MRGRWGQGSIGALVLWSLAALGQAPVVDPAFPAATLFGSDAEVYSLAVQPDGRILMGGTFSLVNGVACSRIARLSPSGVLDLSFIPRANSTVFCIAVQPDGRILVGGVFTTVGGVPRRGIARLEANGSLDASFNPGVDGVPGNGNGAVYAMLIQADGKTLVGGYFSTLGGQPRACIGRLNADGSVDTGFNPGADGVVFSFAVQPDGKTLMGGDFRSVAGQARRWVARLNPDSSLDATFVPAVGGRDDDYPGVYAFALQPDGKVLVGGSFSKTWQQPPVNLVRLAANGALDSSFVLAVDGAVYSLAQQENGGILVGGAFSSVGSQSRVNLARLHADGTLDTNFVAQVSYGEVYALTQQKDGNVLVGGLFSSVAGKPRYNLARLLLAESATESLLPTATSVTWLRGGSAPSVWRTTFERSTDLTQWTPLGDGARVSGGWSVGLSGVTGGMFRARGYTMGGVCNSSGGIVETLAGAPFVTAHPMCRTNDFGTAATFSVQALGSASFAYEWRRNGVLLAEGGNVSGTHQATLVLSPVAGADAGDYDVVVLNSLGAVTSSVARLTVVDPIIVAQPVRQRGAKGSSVTLAVTAAGTGPLRYRWRKDGVALPDAVSNTLVFSQVSLSDTGDYDVMVSNDWGTVVSGSAALELLAEVDPGFAPSFSGEVRGVAVQPDGRILAGGVYTSAVRLKRDGTTDTWYKSGGDSPYGFAVQADGKSLQAAGSDPSPFGSTGLVRRVHAYGTLDGTLQIGWNAGVRVALPQPDGRLLLGGSLLSFGNPGVRIERVFPDGSRDNTFALGASSGLCWTLALQPDGRILVGGAFTALGTQNRANIGRLLADGSVDGTFNPGANYSVNAIAVQADGKILIGGSFTVVAGQTRNRLARLFLDGALDASFNPNANASVSTLALQTDGRIVVGGSFTTLGGVVRNRIARLSPDGTPDAAFDPGANGTVQAVAVEAEGSVLAGGAFTELGGLPRQRMARILTTRAVTSALDREGNRLHWRRSGPAPEAWRVTFEHSADWAHWTPLGEGTRCVDGWELQDVAPTGGAYRAIGYTVGGLGCGSSGLVEATLNFSQSDSHGDGLPDWWYARYGLNPAGPSVADDDWDGDGLNNRDERTAGTDPLDRTSRFAFTSTRIAASAYGPPRFAANFGTVPGRIYSLETRESLPQGDWVRSSSIMASGTGSGCAVSMTTDRTNCFVRIVVTEP